MSTALAVVVAEPAVSLGIQKIDCKPLDVIGMDDEEKSEVYRAKLEESFLHKIDLVIDFSSLKTCLDPLAEPSEENHNNSEFEYDKFVYETFEMKHEKMTSLQKLVLRKIPSPRTPTEIDNYGVLCHGMLQLSSLTELDISGNSVPKDLQSNLQLWNMQSLKKLLMDNTSLQTFPASVGRLRKLEVLSLTNNHLSDLPVTLQFCENLRVLNLQKNNFRQIPGIVLHLKKLEELRRLNNPLSATYDISGPRYVRCNTNTPKKKTNEPTKFNPHSLQTLCSKTIFSSQLDYWQKTTIGPLQCKTLDRLAATFALCEHCNRSIPSPGEYTVEVLLVTYLELSGVAFLLHVCSKNCQDMVSKEYGDKNVRLQKEADEKYERNIKEAQRLVNNNSVDISPQTINAPEGQVQQFVPQWPRGAPYRRNNRRRHKCAIM